MRASFNSKIVPRMAKRQDGVSQGKGKFVGTQFVTSTPIDRYKL